MKKLFLAFVTLPGLIPCFAQPNEQHRETSPVPGCGWPIPAIVMTNPQSQQICPGSNVTFTASAAMAGGVRWGVSTDNGVTWGYTIPNSSATPFELDKILDSLTILNITPEMNGYLFRCEYISPCGPASKTGTATLTVGSVGISIGTQPANTSVCKYTAADFTVAATGSSPDYQWQQSIDGGAAFTNIPGRTNSTLTLDSVTLAMNSYQYRCITGSSCATAVISSPAILTVRDESTRILTQPASQHLCSSDTAVLSVIAQGNDLSYQWQDYYTADIDGATGATLRLPYQGGHTSYRCKIESTCKTIYSNTAVLNYTIVPHLLPAQVLAVCNGQQAYLSAINNYDESLPSLQWQVSTDSGATFNDVPNGNTYYLAVSGSASVNGNQYRCHITNNCFNGFSNIFKVYNTHTPAVITRQPQSKETCAGAAVIFSTGSAEDIPVPGYQWQVSTNNGANFSDLDNGVGKDLTLAAVTASMNHYQYRCKVLGCGDTTYSNPAILTVKPTPFLGNDTAVTVNCDTCSAGIANLYNTAGFASTYWSTTHPESVRQGKYYVKVFNTEGCNDSAFVYVNVNAADTIRACKLAAVTVTSGITGTTYQWEWDSYGYFSEMPEVNNPVYNEVIAGTHSPVLQLAGIDIAGRLIRCRVNGTLFTNNIYIKPTAYWSGAVDTSWTNPLNWSCGQVPDVQTEVIIPENTGRRPFINTDASCKKLFIRKNTGIIIAPGVNVRIGTN